MKEISDGRVGKARSERGRVRGETDSSDVGFFVVLCFILNLENGGEALGGGMSFASRNKTVSTRVQWTNRALPPLWVTRHKSDIMFHGNERDKRMREEERERIIDRREMESEKKGRIEKVSFKQLFISFCDLDLKLIPRRGR